MCFIFAKGDNPMSCCTVVLFYDVFGLILKTNVGARLFTTDICLELMLIKIIYILCGL